MASSSVTLMCSHPDMTLPLSYTSIALILGVGFHLCQPDGCKRKLKKETFFGFYLTVTSLSIYSMLAFCISLH